MEDYYLGLLQIFASSDRMLRVLPSTKEPMGVSGFYGLEKDYYPKCPFSIGQELELTKTMSLDGPGNVKGDLCIVTEIREEVGNIYVQWKTGKNKHVSRGGTYNGIWYINRRLWYVLQPVKAIQCVSGTTAQWSNPKTTSPIYFPNLSNV